MIEDKELITRAYKYGHFWNPVYPDCQNVGYGDIPKLILQDKVARQAALSWQEADANLDLYVMFHHGRATEFTDEVGNVGPATKSLATTKRCGLPDYAPPAHLHIDTLRKIYLEGTEGQSNDYEICDCAHSYQKWAAATGRGSWPVPGCDPERTNREKEHSLRVGINSSGASSHQKSMLDRCLINVENISGEVGLAVRHIVNGSGQVEKDVAFQFIAGSTIGFAYFPQPGTCNQTVRARIDNSYNADVDLLSLLYTHEWEGHSNGLEHTRGGVMNPSIMRVPLTWANDPSWPVVKKYFGGVPIDQPTPPPPDPPPPTPSPPGAIATATYRLEDVTPRGVVEVATEKIRIVIKTKGS